MAARAATLLGRLEATRWSFGTEAARRRREWLRALLSRPLRSARDIERLHDVRHVLDQFAAHIELTFVHVVGEDRVDDLAVLALLHHHRRRRVPRDDPRQPARHRHLFAGGHVLHHDILADLDVVHLRRHLEIELGR